MEKKRIHEIAKELKTNSKRLMEKLEEIDIHPKGAMSYLEEGELEALKKHLGIQDEPHQDEKEEEKKNVITRQIDKGKNKDVTIIKRVVNFVENDDDKKETDKNQNKRKTTPRRTSVASSGLRAGYVTSDMSYESLANKAAQKNKQQAKAKEEKKVITTSKQDAVAEKKDVASANKEIAKPASTEAPSVEIAKVETKPKDEVKVTNNSDNSKSQNNNKAVEQAGNKANMDDKNKQTESVKAEPKKEEVKEAKSTITSDVIEEKAIAKDVKAEQKVDTAKKSTEEKADKPAAYQSKSETAKTADSRPAKTTTGSRPATSKPASSKPADSKSNNTGAKRPYKKDATNFNKTPRHMDKDDDDDSRKPKYDKKRNTDKVKTDNPLAEDVEKTTRKNEQKRSTFVKDADKNQKREFKKEAPKSTTSGTKNKNYKPEKLLVGEKKKVNEVYNDNFAMDVLDDNKRRKKNNRKDKRRPVNRHQNRPQVKAVLTNITIPEVLTVKELAESLKKTSAEVIKKLLGMGVVATLNQEVDFATAEIIADEFGVKAELRNEVSEEDILFEDEVDNDPEAEPRPPVVVVMGHVDHGKTSLLDRIRKASVTSHEAGGITQHIGAYTVKLNNRNITFLDTPGHEAFTAMRARGAQVTDVAILVVAADDGVMPQTIEAINHAKAAKVSIIVAINKMDKPAANVEKVKQELTEYGLVAEEWGGDTIMVPCSAKTGENIDTLLEMVLLTADMLELKANPRKQAKGTIIDAKLDKARGPLATVLVQRGTLRVGDSIVTGTTVGRIRAMNNYLGNSIDEAGPSTPVEILGLPEVPEAGEIFHAIKDEKLAKSLAEKRKNKIREEHIKSNTRVTLDDLFDRIKEGEIKDLNIIVKADVQGSVEAVKQSLLKLSNDEVRVNVIHSAVGAITETDITLADVSNAIIIGFNVRPGTNVTEAAETAGVDMRLYNVIYKAIEDVEAAMKGMLDPTFKEVVNGHAEVRQIYKVSNVGTVAGCYVQDGKIVRNSEVRVVRDGIVIYTGKLKTLRRFKDDVKEVAQNYECGISIENFNDVKENDVIESFSMEEIKR